MHRCTVRALPLLLAAPALAHQAGISQGSYRVSGGEIRMELAFSASELDRAYPDRQSGVTDLATRGVEILGDAAPCPCRLQSHEPVEGDGVVVVVTATCETAPAHIVLRSFLHDRLGPYHRHLARLQAGTRVHEAVLARQQPVLDADLPPPAPAARTMPFLLPVTSLPALLLVLASALRPAWSAAFLKLPLAALLGQAAGIVLVAATGIRLPPSLLPGALAIGSLVLALDALRPPDAPPIVAGDAAFSAWAGGLLGCWAAVELGMGGPAATGLAARTGEALSVLIGTAAIAGVAAAAGRAAGTGGTRWLRRLLLVSSGVLLVATVVHGSA